MWEVETGALLRELGPLRRSLHLLAREAAATVAAQHQEQTIRDDSPIKAKVWNYITVMDHKTAQIHGAARLMVLYVQPAAHVHMLQAPLAWVYSFQPDSLFHLKDRPQDIEHCKLYHGEDVWPPQAFLIKPTCTCTCTLHSVSKFELNVNVTFTQS